MAFTAIAGTTKIASVKTARSRTLSVKELVADAAAVACPSHALKSVECHIEGINESTGFGDFTIGQKITGKIMIYCAEHAIRQFVHELVTKPVTYCNITTNSGMSYTFQSADDTPAICFTYKTVDLALSDDKPVLAELEITGFRDNLVID